MPRAILNIQVSPNIRKQTYLKVIQHPYKKNIACKVEIGAWSEAEKRFIFPSEYVGTVWTDTTQFLLEKEKGRAYFVVFTDSEAPEDIIIDYAKGTSTYTRIGSKEFTFKNRIDWSGQIEQYTQVGPLAELVDFSHSIFFDIDGKKIDSPWWDEEKKCFRTRVPSYGSSIVEYSAYGSEYVVYYDNGAAIGGIEFNDIQHDWAYSTSDVRGPDTIVFVNVEGAIETLNLERNYDPPYFGDRIKDNKDEQVNTVKYLCYKVWTGATEQEIAQKTKFEIHRRVIEYTTTDSITGVTKKHTRYYGDIPESDWCPGNPFSEETIEGGVVP